MSDIGELMKNTMSLCELPNVLISVVGGLHFDISEELKEKLQAGLQNVRSTRCCYLFKRKIIPFIRESLQCRHAAKKFLRKGRFW